MSDCFGLLHDASFDADLARGDDRPDFFEVIADRFLAVGDASAIPERPTTLPIVFHTLDLSLGSDEPLDGSYLDHIALLARHFRPMWASDHLAMTHIEGIRVGHLSPIRCTLAAAHRIAGKVARIQDALQMPFLVENIAYYFRLPGAEITEGELLHVLVEKTGCGLLLDLNNLAVNAANHHFDPCEYLREVPLHAVHEIHVAGHRRSGEMYIDSHGEAVAAIVWDLLRFVAARLESVNVVLERDQDVPRLGELMRELAIARRCVVEARNVRAAAGALN